MKDVTGKEFQVNSRVVYPGRQGSCVWMNIGTIIDFKHYRNHYTGCIHTYFKIKRDKGGKVVYVYNTHNCVIIG